jgi:ribosomal protein L11 methylase PrmA
VKRFKVVTELARQPLSFIATVDAARTGSVGLVVANISPEAIIALTPELMRTLRAGGIAIVSGFELAEVGSVEAALAASGARVRESRAKNDWSVVVGIKR